MGASLFAGVFGQVLAELQEGDARSAEAAGAAQALRSENATLQAHLTKVITECFFVLFYAILFPDDTVVVPASCGALGVLR